MTIRDVAATLRGEALAPGLDPGAWLTVVERHGVAPLAYRALHDRGRLAELPGVVGDALARAAREAALLESLRRDDAETVLGELAAAGVRPLVYKGAAVAYSHYPEPWLRWRADTDLLVAEDDRAAASRVFERLGFVRTVRPSGRLVTNQSTYAAARRGARTIYDVHWKIADPIAFADLLRYETLDARAVALPALAPVARRLSDVDAIAVACIHRVAHHNDAETLADLYDLALLARGLAADGWQRLVTLASAVRIRRVCARGLTLAADLFDVRVPDQVRHALAEGGEAEATSAYLGGRLRRIDLLRSDLQALGGWRARLTLLREHVLPAPAYILDYYGRRQPLLLPALYLHRILRGAGDWFRPIR